MKSHTFHVLLIAAALILPPTLVGCRAGKPTKENFKKLRDGMTQEEVWKILGPSALREETGYDDEMRYVWTKVGSGHKSKITVVIREGKVVRHGWTQ
jgi:outer membrane protein assembly factor BamE (lipoprotein component of BamABCDE complex)